MARSVLSSPSRRLLEGLARDVAEAPEAGSVYARRRGGIEYLYAKIPVGSERADRFLGKAGDPAAEAEAAALRGGQQLARGRREAVSILRRRGLAGPGKRPGAILDAIAKAGLFADGAVLVGNAAFDMLGPLAGGRFPADTGGAAIALTLAGVSAEQLEPLLRRADPTFAATGDRDDGERRSRYRNARGDVVALQTESSLPDRSTGPKPPPDLLVWLIEDPVPSVALWGSGIAVRIPQPARFAAHRLILAQYRDTAGRSKDLAQALALIEALTDHDPLTLETQIGDARSRDPKWRDAIDRSLAEIGYAWD